MPSTIASQSSSRKGRPSKAPRAETRGTRGDDICPWSHSVRSKHGGDASGVAGRTAYDEHAELAVEGAPSGQDLKGGARPDGHRIEVPAQERAGDRMCVGGRRHGGAVSRGVWGSPPR